MTHTDVCRYLEDFFLSMVRLSTFGTFFWPIEPNNTDRDARLGLLEDMQNSANESVAFVSGVDENAIPGSKIDIAVAKRSECYCLGSIPFAFRWGR